MINSWTQEIENNLINTLEDLLPKHSFSEVISYSLIPAGKYFRPLLAYSLAKDQGKITTDHKLLAQALEMHHTYTLIHDDLPAMDDDNERRGRASAHVKFNEWSAILSGDALLNMSYEILADISPELLPKIIKLFGEYLGPRGLILGQVMDLAGESTSIEQITTLHELKTARLIQLALEASNILSGSKIKQETIHKLGLAIGVNFQLLDDLCELTEPINKHEREVNPFLNLDNRQLMKVLAENHCVITESFSDNKLNHLSSYLDIYHQKISGILSSGLDSINQHIKLTGKDISRIC